MRRRHLNFPLSILNFEFQNRRPRPSGTPSNLEGDEHGRHCKVGKSANLPTAQNRQRLLLP